MKKIVLFSLCIIGSVSLCAQTEAEAEVVASEPTIFETLATPDSTQGAVVLVYQEEIMKKAIESQQNSEPLVQKHGFRVQVFSSNNVKTSRDDAFRMEKTIHEKDPNLSTYVTYTAPFWKVRVGNCATNEDAQRLRQYILEQFPQFQSQIYIVPSEIELNR